MSVRTDAVPSVFPAFPSHLQCKRHVRKAPADRSTAALTTLTAAPSSSAAAPDKLSATSLAAAVASHCQLSSTTTVPFHVVDYAMDSLSQCCITASSPANQSLSSISSILMTLVFRCKIWNICGAMSKVVFHASDAVSRWSWCTELLVHADAAFKKHK